MHDYKTNENIICSYGGILRSGPVYINPVGITEVAVLTANLEEASYFYFQRRTTPKKQCDFEADNFFATLKATKRKL